MDSLLRQCFDWPIVRRALFFAVVVGSVLISINHGDAILAGEVDQRRLVKMALTVMVPYMVSTISSVSTLRQIARQHDDQRQNVNRRATPER